MVGLPFPNPGPAAREQSWDNGTPFSGDDIPIDPALAEPPLDPALMADGGGSITAETPHPPPLYQPYHLPRVHSYPEGPQGDPFAQPPPIYVPVEEPVPLPVKPLKKKKRPAPREEQCGFCSGNDFTNKDGQSEMMVSCVDCGRSGHPSCMGLDNMGDAMRSYEWQCATCKSCSVCRRKGDEASMLICDFCDRGWHMSCFTPPFREPPEGRWHCPSCPPVGSIDFDLYSNAPISDNVDGIQQVLPPITPVRESSVASSSRHVPPSSDVPEVTEHNPTTDTSEVEVDMAEPTPRRSTRPRKIRKGKEVATLYELEQEAASSTPVSAVKRLRIRIASPATPENETQTQTIRLRVPARGKGKAREEPTSDDHEQGLFDDILSVEDRDIRDTTIGVHDHERFEKSRSKAEQRIVPRPPPEPPETPIAGPSRPSLRSHASVVTPRIPDPSMSPAPSATPGPQVMHLPNGLRIRRIRFGEFDIETWYDAPFPEEYAAIPDGRLWMCEYCLKYMKSRFSATRHQLKCKVRHPPGDEIYRDGRISIFEVDGRKNKIFCQNLCLLSKMFLDHKSLFYDVEPFLFYVITEADEAGAHFVGYFSKEKLSPKNYNVSCIMTLPVRQRQGWGNLLIDFSYLLSKKEQRAGSPEKPLSALGRLGYMNYWTLSLMRYLQTAPPNPRLEDISVATSMTLEDIHTVLVELNMISVLDSAQPPKPLPGQTIKFPKGRKNGIARKHLQRTLTQDEEKPRGPFVPPTRYKVVWDADQVDEYLARWEAKGHLKLRPEKLKWSPFILSRAKKTQTSEGVAAVGQANGDVARGLSAEFPPSETNGTLADGLETPSEQRGPVESTPAFSLFDDDNVEIVRASAPRDIARSEITDADDSRARSPFASEEPVLSTRSKRKQVASIRRLRSRDSVSESTPLRRRPQVPRSDTVPQSEKRRSNLRSRHGDLPVTPTPRPHTNGYHTSTPSVDEDAALAARLAMELENPQRQLRSRRPSTDQHPIAQKRAAPTPRSASPNKKRRRVDSSPEVEMTPSPRSPVTRRSTRRGGSPLTPAMPVTSTPSRRSSRRTNGRFSAKPAVAPVTLPEVDEDAELAQLPESSLLDENGDGDDDAYGEGEPEDGQYEDADTPITGATVASRHSVPSDDTMIGGELARSKVSPLAMPRMAMGGLEVLAQAADALAQAAAVQIEANAVMDEDGDGDEDAEGEEDDVDAEGEPDDDMEP